MYMSSTRGDADLDGLAWSSRVVDYIQWLIPSSTDAILHHWHAQPHVGRQNVNVGGTESLLEEADL